MPALIVAAQQIQAAKATEHLPGLNPRVAGGRAWTACRQKSTAASVLPSHQRVETTAVVYKI